MGYLEDIPQIGLILRQSIDLQKLVEGPIAMDKIHTFIEWREIELVPADSLS